jgi:uncharacterized membrane protein
VSPAEEPGTPGAESSPPRGRDEAVALPASLRTAIVWTLRAGVGLSAGILAVGLIDLAVRGGFSATASGQRVDWSALANGFAVFSPPTVLLVGILVLILTPVLRVILSFALFARQRDGAFAALTLFVLLMLIGSVLIGVTL